MEVKMYYKVWADCIHSLKKTQKDNSWKWLSMLMMTFAMAINLMFILVILGQVSSFPKGYNDLIDVDIFPGKRLDRVLVFFILYMMPIGVFNYLFIFLKDKEFKFLKKYPSKNGKLFMLYLILSLLIPAASLVILVFYQQFFNR